MTVRRYFTQLVIALVIGALWTPAALAQTTAVEAVEDEVPIDEVVAGALYERGMVLFGRGDVRNAKQLFIESVERGPSGERAEDAKSMVRTCNERLGIEDRDDGLPGHVSATPADPYGEQSGSKAKDADPVAQIDRDNADQMARVGFMSWSGGYGLVAGLALGGPVETDDNGEDKLGGGAVLAGLAGAAGFAGLSYWLDRRYQWTEGQKAAIASAGTWGAVNFGFLGDVFTGRESDTNDVFKFIAAGGAVGLGAGALYAIKKEPTEHDVAFINSLSAYGIAGGLLVGVMLSPPRDEAYSLNAFFGSALGLTAGVLLADRFDLSRRRTLWLDLGAAAGVASAWVVLYPIVADGGSNNDEQAVGGISVLTMAAGVLGAWWLTRGLDSKDETPGGSALLSRSPSGLWALGTPAVQLVPGPRGRGLGATLRLVGGEI